MPATVRYDEQYCPIARALDVLGDRWTLLILRELVNGDQRFTDLRTNLPGIALTVLTQRLRALTDEGLVTTGKLPPPAARSVYTLTDRGRSTGPVLSALARWGMPLPEPPDEVASCGPTGWSTSPSPCTTTPSPPPASTSATSYGRRPGGDAVVGEGRRGAPPRAGPDHRRSGGGGDRDPPRHHHAGRGDGSGGSPSPDRRRRWPTSSASSGCREGEW